MFKQAVSLLLTIAIAVDGAVIASEKWGQLPTSQPTCACTQTVNECVPVELKARQEACTVTITETSIFTVTHVPALATIVADNPNAVSSYLSKASALSSAQNNEQSQDRPTGYTDQTTWNFVTATAQETAVIGSDDPYDSVTLYKSIGINTTPVATATWSYPPWDTPRAALLTSVPSSTAGLTSLASLDVDGDGIVTLTTYLSTSTLYLEPATTSPPSNLSIISRDLQKRQTCSMVFARISGEWASWCNNWRGSIVSLPSSFNATELMTSVAGASPIPQSVYDPSGTLSKQVTTTAQLTATSIPSALPSPAQEATSTTTPSSIPKPTGEPTSTSTPGTLPGHSQSATTTSTPTALPKPPSPSSSSVSANSSPNITSIAITRSVVVTIPIITLTQTFPGEKPSSTSAVPTASSTCGEVGNFTITFDDLPAFSTSNPNETEYPPIFDPYRHFYWTDGYSYGPPPSSPYAPHDGTRLALYNPQDATETVNDTTQGRNVPGSFGAGYRFANNIYWFDAKSAYVGCNNTNSGAPCDVVATGYRWVADPSNPSSAPGHEEKTGISQRFTAPGPCSTQPCQLTQITFDSSLFSGLSSIHVEANMGGAAASFYLDSFQASWANNSCEAGIVRKNSRK